MSFTSILRVNADHKPSVCQISSKSVQPFLRALVTNIQTFTFIILVGHELIVVIKENLSVPIKF